MITLVEIFFCVDWDEVPERTPISVAQCGQAQACP